MGFMDDSETHFAIRKLAKTLAKPIAIVLAFAALVLFLMKTLSGINAR